MEAAKIKIMDITIELEKLQDYMNNCDTVGFKSCLKELYEKCNDGEKEAVSLFLEEKLGNSTARVKNTVNDIQARIQLENVIDILPLAYISKNYFNKTRQWLYQRINGNIVNGKSVQFTDSEIETFNYALQDISKRIGSTVIHS